MKNNAVVLDHESLLVWHNNFIWVNCDWKIFRHQSVAHSSVIRSVIFQQKHHKIFWLVLFNIFIWFKNIERIAILRIKASECNCNFVLFHNLRLIHSVQPLFCPRNNVHSFSMSYVLRNRSRFIELLASLIHSIPKKDCYIRSYFMFFVCNDDRG